MNPYCATAEMTEVHNEVLIRANRTLCACGAAKENVTRPWCNRCVERIVRFDRGLYTTLWKLCRTDTKTEFLVLYDTVTDMLLDPNFSTARKRNHLEEHDGR